MLKPESGVLSEGKYTIAISPRPKQSGEGSRSNEGGKLTSSSSEGERPRRSYIMSMNSRDSRLRSSKRKA